MFATRSVPRERAETEWRGKLKTDRRHTLNLAIASSVRGRPRRYMDMTGA
jgi:hypothetical protein